jgi:hypothetical protein
LSQHTKEPWFALNNGNYFEIREAEEAYSQQIGDVCSSKFMREGDLGKENADHIVACVNACAGINPAAVPMMMAAMLKTIDYLNLRADKESSELWSEVANAVRVAKRSSDFI